MLTITTPGNQDHGRCLDAIYRRLGDLTPVMQSMGMELKSEISGRFGTHTNADGQFWAPCTLAN